MPAISEIDKINTELKNLTSIKSKFQSEDLSFEKEEQDVIEKLISDSDFVSALNTFRGALEKKKELEKEVPRDEKDKSDIAKDLEKLKSKIKDSKQSIIETFDKEIDKNQKIVDAYKKMYDNLKEIERLNGLTPVDAADRREQETKISKCNANIEAAKEILPESLSKEVIEKVEKEKRKSYDTDDPTDLPETGEPDVPIDVTGDDAEKEESSDVATESIPGLEIPTDICSKPKISLKTFIAIGLGVATGAGIYLMTGPLGVSISLAATGIIKKLVKKKRKKYQEEIQQLETEKAKLAQRWNALAEEQSNIDKLIQIINDLKAEEETSEKLEEIKTKEEELASKKAAYDGHKSTFNSDLNNFQEAYLNVYQKIHPDLKDEKYKTDTSLKGLAKAGDFIKKKAKKFKDYLVSDEGLRDVNAGLTALKITGISCLAYDTLFGLRPFTTTQTVVNQGTKTVSQTTTYQSPLDLARAGKNVTIDAKNITPGTFHQHAALDDRGVNALSKYVNASHGSHLSKIYNGREYFTPDGTRVWSVLDKYGRHQGWISEKALRGLGQATKTVTSTSASSPTYVAQTVTSNLKGIEILKGNGLKAFLQSTFMRLNGFQHGTSFDVTRRIIK